MNEPASAVGSPLVQSDTGGPSRVAVGIPQGVIVDRASGDVAGAVRRGGEIVSLSAVEYGMWTILLTPMTHSAVIQLATKRNWGNVDEAIARLHEHDLLATIELGQSMDDDLAGLRALPLGVGMGNVSGDPLTFEIQNAALSLSAPLRLDVVSVVFWWEFDGTKTLRQVAAHVASRIPGLSIDDAEMVASHLAYGLMSQRLLYLDFPVSRQGR